MAIYNNRLEFYPQQVQPCWPLVSLSATGFNTNPYIEQHHGYQQEAIELWKDAQQGRVKLNVEQSLDHNKRAEWHSRTTGLLKGSDQLRPMRTFVVSSCEFFELRNRAGSRGFMERKFYFFLE
jgi:hypothetical protein